MFTNTQLITSGFVRGVIRTTKLYITESDETYLKLEVISNLIKLGMLEEDIEYWIHEYFGE